MVNLALFCTVINLIVFISYIFIFVLNKKRKDEITSLKIQVLAAQSYQVIGEITCGMPDNPQIIDVLDYFSGIADGRAQVDFYRSLSISAHYEKAP